MTRHPIAPEPDLVAITATLHAAGLPTSDLTEAHRRHFFYAGDALRPAGIVGVELLGDAGLLRSLAVCEHERGTGLGSALVAHAEDHARSAGVQSIYLLTTTAEAFFAARGYARVSREDAPAAVRSTAEFSGICPSSSALMLKQL